MSNPTVYKFIYESIADATQVDNSVEEMGLESEYKEQLSAAARKAGINERTARNMLKKYEDDDEYKRCDDTH
ncbi:hypothetical protein G6F36_015422 [Rhizopus arrhizus]|nr:hypothetical protein G6F36_015422 [Rhizopus arrhizus]